MTKGTLFQCIDFDRTLFDTSRFVKALTDEVDRIHPGMGVELDKKFESAYKAERTFFLMRHLRSTLGADVVMQLVEALIKRHKGDRFLLPGALERIQLADEMTTERPSWGLLTYGDVADQKLKIAIAGLNQAPLYMTDTPHKAAVIASWQQTDGTFQLPQEFGGNTVAQLTLEDDKLRAFNGLPKGVIGVWVHPGEHTGEYQDIVTNGGVVTEAPSVAESGELLNHLFSK